MSTTSDLVRGVAWPAASGVPYPRADPADARRLPADTWATACVPAGVRLELTGDATAVEIDYTTATDDPGYRGAGAGVTFEAWADGRPVDEQPARPSPAAAGPATATVRVGPGTRTIIYLPEGLGPHILAVRPLGGDIAPAPAQPRWVAYGDSITEGWVAGSPARNWVATVGREVGLDAVNLGYAGSARGELASAEQIAAIDAELLSVAFGTNCWSMVPHTAAMVEATTGAFLQILRQGHPAVPIIVVSPLLRPDAESTPNRLGATLADIRRAVEHAAATVAGTHLVAGRDLLGPAHLPDGVHPGDEGHRVLADAMATVVRPIVAGSAAGH